MADVTGAHTSTAPIISANTAAIIRHKAAYYNGSGSISIPLVKGHRFIVHAVLTNGGDCSMGFGAEAGTITDSKFTFTQTSGPLDLSAFFRSAPFAIYKEPSTDFAYFIITGTGAITAAITTFIG